MAGSQQIFFWLKSGLPGLNRCLPEEPGGGRASIGDKNGKKRQEASAQCANADRLCGATVFSTAHAGRPHDGRQESATRTGAGDTTRPPVAPSRSVTRTGLRPPAGTGRFLIPDAGRTNLITPSVTRTGRHFRREGLRAEAFGDKNGTGPPANRPSLAAAGLLKRRSVTKTGPDLRAAPGREAVLAGEWTPQAGRFPDLSPVRPSTRPARRLRFGRIRSRRILFPVFVAHDEVLQAGRYSARFPPLSPFSRFHRLQDHGRSIFVAFYPIPVTRALTYMKERGNRKSLGWIMSGKDNPASEPTPGTSPPRGAEGSSITLPGRPVRR